MNNRVKHIMDQILFYTLLGIHKILPIQLFKNLILINVFNLI